MNHKDKVINAINHYEGRIAERTKQEAILEAVREVEDESRLNVIRVLHAVYGERARHGCVLRGKQYRVEPGRNDIGQTDTLHIDQADFEVLG